MFLTCDCSDASFGYPGGPLLFQNLNFGIDLDSRIASKHASSPTEFSCFHSSTSSIYAFYVSSKWYYISGGRWKFIMMVLY
jgi:hypothetical protein